MLEADRAVEAAHFSDARGMRAPTFRAMLEIGRGTMTIHEIANRLQSANIRHVLRNVRDVERHCVTKAAKYPGIGYFVAVEPRGANEDDFVVTLEATKDNMSPVPRRAG
jgi:hypothetical protein